MCAVFFVMVGNDDPARSIRVHCVILKVWYNSSLILGVADTFVHLSALDSGMYCVRSGMKPLVTHSLSTWSTIVSTNMNTASKEKHPDTTRL